MEDLAKRKKMRAGHRGSATKLVTKIVQKLEGETDEEVDKNWLIQSKLTLEGKIESLKALDGQILELISDLDGESVEQDIEKEIDEADNINAELHKVILDINEVVRKRCTPPSSLKINTPPTSAVQLSLPSKNVRVRLPKLEVLKFDGSVCKWQEFWDSFESSIDGNEGLSSVDKFSYLRGLLEGPAKSTIAGLSLTSANYGEALGLLKKRYGKKNVVERAHVKELIGLLPVFSDKDTQRLRRLYDSCETHYRGLLALGVDPRSYESIVVPSIMEKLPESFRLTITRGSDFLEWTMMEMLKAFVKELELKEQHQTISTTKEQFSSKQESRQRGKEGNDRPATAAALLTQNDRNNKPSCAFCLKNHAHEECQEVKDHKIRKTLVYKYARCFRCLSKGHRARDCKISVPCKGCGGSHHTALCEGRSETTIKESANHLANSKQGGTITKVALQTACALVKGPEREGRLRVLFDSGSHRSFVTSSAVRALGMRVVRRELLSISTFGQGPKETESRDVVEINVMPFRGGNVTQIEAYVVPKISSIQNESVDVIKKDYPYLKNLWFSDVTSKVSKDSQIDILIGADYLWCFQGGRTVRGEPDQPVAVETKLGWVLSGPLKRCSGTEETQTAQANLVVDDSGELETNVHKLWDLEALGISERDEVHESFVDSISFDGNRYSVMLPWKESHEVLPSNYANSLARMKGQIRRLKKEPEVLIEYDSIIKEQLKLGIIEKVVDLERAENAHYLPHQAVIRRDAETTKVRVVYDASAKEGKNGTSLNDCLHVGPSLNPLLFDILIRFRCHKVVLVGDIEKAFLNIEVDKGDRDCLRFLWVEDVLQDNLKVVVYRFCRVVFGLNASPFLLNGTLRHHISLYEDADPEFVRKMVDGFYVDDLVTGECAADRAYKLYEKARDRLAEGGFRLRKWKTNDRELKVSIDPQKQSGSTGSKVVRLDEEETYAKATLGLAAQGCAKSEKVLGVVWDSELDVIKFMLTPIADKAEGLVPTKRNVLSILAGVFDPLGVIGPVTVSMKMLFQDLCSRGFKWDEELTGEVSNRLKAWIEDLHRAKEITINRCVNRFTPGKVTKCYLHGFGDASKKAYCSVIYLVCHTDAGVSVELLTSKTRVAPLKALSIPRLELMSAWMLAKQMRAVLGALESEVEITGTRLWLDSKTALYWIMNRGEWKQFVQHRVNEILKLTSKKDWGHCPGESNPADLGSRGVIATKLKQSQIWWEGPSWLAGTLTDWPATTVTNKTLETSEEEKKSTVLIVNVEKPVGIKEVVSIERYGGLRKLIRVTAWVKRFVYNLQAATMGRAKRSGEIAVVEGIEAEKEWILAAQAELKKDNKFSQLVSSLGLQDMGGMLRCRGRLENAELAFSARNPIILPRDHVLTEMIVRDCHQRVCHSGVRSTLAELRARYWVPKGRQMVKKILGKCVTCKKHEGGAYGAPSTAPLPEFRVTEAAPFSKVGVDFAGPLYVKGGVGSSEKVYIAVFTCCVTRAVHLDLVEDLSAATFNRCLRKFTARRGTPHLMVSDNAKTFQATAKALKELYEHPEVRAETGNKRIMWRFNLERAPWWGGFFERMVGLVKRCLRKVLGNARLTFDELLTIIVEIEGTLNARPLTYEYEELEEEVLTPSHLIYGRRITSIPDEIVEDREEMSGKERYGYLSKKLAHFWNRWRREYLADLREFHRLKSASKDRTVEVGDVVTVHDECKKRGEWRMAIIESLIEGTDNVVRGANIRIITKGKPSRMARPIQKLYPIEVKAGQVARIEPLGGTGTVVARQPSRRAAALDAQWKNRAMLDS